MAGVAMIATAVIAMGCGNEGDSSSVSTGTASPKAAFIEKAGAVCHAARKNAFQRVAAYQERHRSEGLSEAVLSRRATRAVTLSTYEGEIAALRELRAPPGDQSEVEGILDAEAEALEEARKVPKVTGTDLTQASEMSARFRDAGRALRNYGVTGCGKG